ncbi:MAG: TadE family protein [Longimicrobiales bacterium]
MVRFVRKRAHGRGEAGQALVEFAIIMPILLILVLGLVEFSRAWFNYQVMVDAAREGARTGAVYNPPTTIGTIQNKINTQLAAAGMDTLNATITITGFQGGTAQPLTVAIAYPFALRWIGSFLGWTGAQTSFTLNTSVVFRNE